jgi:hypothetical protein
MYAFDELLSGRPSLDHLTQGCLYLAGLQRINPELNEALLLVKNKNTSAYCEFRFTYDPKTDRCHVVELVASEGISRALDLHYDGLVARALDKFDAVETYARRGELPPRPYRHDSWRCHYCPYAHRCWDSYPAEVRARSEATPLDPTVAPLLAEYAQAAAAKRESEAAMKRLRPQILQALEAHHTRTGLAGGYRATVTVQERPTLDESLIPEDVKQAARVMKLVETLRVTSTAEPPEPLKEADAA